MTTLLIIPDKPSAPENLKVTEVTERQVGLKWSEPHNDGGLEITGYLVEYREAVRRSWQKAGTVSATEGRQFTVKALDKGQQYYFRVAAENGAGVGEFAELTQSVTAKSQFGKCPIRLYNYIL